MNAILLLLFVSIAQPVDTGWAAFDHSCQADCKPGGGYVTTSRWTCSCSEGHSYTYIPERDDIPTSKLTEPQRAAVHDCLELHRLTCLPECGGQLMLGSLEYPSTCGVSKGGDVRPGGGWCVMPESYETCRRLGIAERELKELRARLDAIEDRAPWLFRSGPAETIFPMGPYIINPQLIPLEGERNP